MSTDPPADRADLVMSIVEATAMAGAAGAGGLLGPGVAAAATGFAVLLIEAVRRDRLDRARGFVEDVAEGTDLNAFADALRDSQRLRDLTWAATDAATRTSWTGKRVLLARAVARAAEDDARLDAEEILIVTAAAIEAPAARMLRALADLPRSGFLSPLTGSAGRHQLAALLPGDEDLADALIAPLVRAGLAEDGGLGVNGTSGR